MAVHSSTSSSELFQREPAPAAPWGRIFIVALALAAAALGTIEFLGRRIGFHPTPVDSPALWTARRLQTRDKRDAVVLIGSSRFQLGLDPVELQRHVPNKEFFNLAVAGVNPLPILEDLANDESFIGTVVCEFMPTRFFAEIEESISGTQEYITAYHSRSAVAGIEQALLVELQQRFVLFQTELQLREVVANYARTRRWPEPSYRTLHASRYVAANFTPAVLANEHERDIANADRLRPGTIAWSPEQIRGWVDRIHSRGGSVIFYRINSSGHTREQEDELFPRAKFYERFAKEIGNARWMSFEDYPSLTKFNCPDEVHLDGSDGAAYAAAVAPVLFPSAGR